MQNGVGLFAIICTVIDIDQLYFALSAQTKIKENVLYNV